MDYLMLVDKFNPVPPECLDKTNFTEIRGKILERQTAEQLEKMLIKAENEGVEIQIISAYRSVEYQKNLFEKSIEEQVKDGKFYSDAVKIVSKSLALPGSSEHNTGLAVDLGTPGSDDTQDDFYKTPQAKWLCRNASDFGFILRYPRMKEHITGFIYEPWHYR